MWPSKTKFSRTSRNLVAEFQNSVCSQQSDHQQPSRRTDEDEEERSRQVPQITCTTERASSLDPQHVCHKFHCQLNTGNVFETMKFAKMIENKTLEKECNEYVLKNFEKISKSNVDFLKLDLNDLVSLLRDGRLSVDTEEVAWDAALRWIKHKEEFRKYKISQILRAFPLRLLDQNFFKAQVKTNEYVRACVACEPVIKETEEYFRQLLEASSMTSTVARAESSSGAVNNETILAIGGISEDDQLDRRLIVEVYSHQTKDWKQLTDIEAEPRGYHGAVCLGNKIFIIGGCVSDQTPESPESMQYVGTCKALHLETMQWSDIASLTTVRGYISVATLGNRIYAIGGVGNEKNVLNSVEVYDPEANSWADVASMTTRRAQACATSLNGKIYAMGGWNFDEWLSTVESYDPATDQWTLVASMGDIRAGACCVSHHNKIYIMGGLNGSKVLISAERYDPEDNCWCYIADMLEPLSEFSAALYQDKIFCIGGEKYEDGGYILTGDVVCYDHKANTWSKLDSKLTVPRHGLCACVCMK